MLMFTNENAETHTYARMQHMRACTQTRAGQKAYLKEPQTGADGAGLSERAGIVPHVAQLQLLG